MSMNQRELALDILYKTIKEESYSNLLMRSQLEKIPQIQRAFVTNLVNGVLRNFEFISYQFEDDLSSSTSFRTKLILCLALYERFFFHEKDYVVNHEYVELGKNKYEKSFINAILRKKKQLKEADKDHIRYSLPEWIYNLLKSQYKEEDLKKIMSVYHEIPKVYYRINKNRCTFDDLKDLNIEKIDEDLFICKDNLLSSKEYEKGYFYIQDVNSASLYRHLDLNENCNLLDVCSAPGSKLFNCLDIVKPENAYGNDLHENRVNLMEKMAEKLGYHGVHFLNYDGRELKDHLDLRFDRILLDAPCSGLGVIGRKPDLKFHVKPQSLDELQKLQYELLESVDPLLKQDGILLYSTCTLNKKENGRLISRFISQHDNYVLLEEDTIINEMGDCFYYAKMKKVNQ